MEEWGVQGRRAQGWGEHNVGGQGTRGAGGMCWMQGGEWGSAVWVGNRVGADGGQRRAGKVGGESRGRGGCWSGGGTGEREAGWWERRHPASNCRNSWRFGVSSVRTAAFLGVSSVSALKSIEKSSV